MSNSGVEVTVFVRHGCHLCDNLLLELDEFRQKHPVAVKVIDIDGDAGLEANYGQRVPVVCAKGKEIGQYFLDVKALLKYIDKP